jgi:hypothetical protein
MNNDPLIHSNSLWYLESIYDVFFYEPNHILSRDVVHQDCFNPHFCEITNGCNIHLCPLLVDEYI